MGCRIMKGVTEQCTARLHLTLPWWKMSDSNTSEEEVDLQLRTSEEERIYRMIKGYTQATQAALSHTRVQSNPTVE